MVNKQLLKIAILSKGLNQKRLANLINLSENSLSKKINNKVEFKSKEIELISKILDINDIHKIFLNGN